MMRRIGADVAGMSTVPEVLAAADVQLRTLGLSMVSNVANPTAQSRRTMPKSWRQGKRPRLRWKQSCEACFVR